MMDLQQLIIEASRIEDKKIKTRSSSNLTTKQQTILAGTSDAYNYASSRINVKDLSWKDYCHINFLVDNYENNQAGKFRTVPIYVGGVNYKPPIWSVSEAIQIIDKFQKIDSFASGVKYWLKLIKFQLFNNGNKRSSLIFTNMILASKNLPLIRVKSLLRFHLCLKKFYDWKDSTKAVEKYIKYLQKQI